MSTISYIIPLRGTPLALRERCFASVRRVLRAGDELITIDDREAAEARNEGLRFRRRWQSRQVHQEAGD